MDANDLRKALRRSRWMIAVTVLTCAVAAIVYTAKTPSRYESRTQLFVAAQEREFSVQRAPSYAGLVESPNVTAPVVAELGLTDTPGALGRRLSAAAPPDTVLINLTVQDSDPVRAQRTGRAVAAQLIKLVAQLERPSAKRAAPVRLDVSSPASLPTDRVSPDARINLAAGLVIGLLLGVLGALLRLRLDGRICEPDDLPGGALLAAIPADGALAAGTRAPSLRTATGGRAEALRRLRTTLRHIDPEAPPRTILVAASLPTEGATTTAVGLAMALAEAGSHIVLVEAHLRRPAIAELFGLRASPGLAEHLAASTGDGPALQRWPGADGGSLRVLVAGATPPNPSALLSSQRMRALLEDLRESGDIVILDAPPILALSDAAALAGDADGVLLVARMGAVTRPELDRALGELARAGARLLGFVANDCVATRADPGYPGDPGSAAVAPRPAAPPPASWPAAGPSRRPRPKPPVGASRATSDAR